MSEIAPETFDRITMFGATWCSDCNRAKVVLDTSGVGWDFIDVDAIEGAAPRAEAISGRKSIPVIVFPDGTHQVEPSNVELGLKIESLRA